jgi:hypothetical protein
MEIMLVLLVFAVVGLALFAWWLVMLIDAVRTPTATWQAAGQEQLLHILLMVFLGVIGTIVYVVVARPKLRAVPA